jgi:hypothetical protein
VTNPLARTLQILTNSRNLAALDLLLWALDQGEPEIRDLALRGLVERRSAAGRRELVNRWPTIPEAGRRWIAERAGRLEGALREAILATQSESHRHACDAVVYLRSYDLIPTLMKAAEDKGNSHPEVAAQATVQLCELLYAELNAPRDYRLRRDPVLVRQYLYTSLRHAVERFDQHGRPELVEAFLLLAQPEDALLRRGLQNSLDRVHSAIVQLLAHSTRPGILRLVLSFLEDSQSPPAMCGVLARRRDAEFLQMLFARCAEGLSPGARANVRRIDSFAWLRDDMDLLLSLSDEEQGGMVRLAVASGVSRLRVFELLKFVMRHGSAPGRRAGCAGLSEFKGGEANHLVLAALDDPDPEVQAHAISQIRDRGIPGVLQRLVELVDSPHDIVRSAARESLTEFNFQRYLSAFEMLQPDVRRSTGELVRRVDPLAMDQLISELASPSRSRRLRGIEVAAAMGAVPDLEQYIVQLAQDEDHFIRAEAARALVHCQSETARHALRELLLDRSVSVQEAAVRTLERLAAKSTPAGANPLLILRDLRFPAPGGSEVMP